MKFKDFLFESRSDIVLVDFQPAYDEICEVSFANVVDELNKGAFGKCMAFYNGESLGLDSKNDVIEYYLESDVNEDALRRIQFIEKGYGYFRDLMDDGIDEAVIIKVIRYLVNNRLRDIGFIDDEGMIEYMEDNGIRVDEHQLHIPDIDVSQLKSISGFRLGGGGKHECLREIEILCNAFNIRYKRVREWVY